MVELTKDQKKHFESVKWLLFGPRACGRTRLMAILFIEHAMENLGRELYVFDHDRSSRYKANRIYLFIDIVFHEQGLDKKFKLNINDKDSLIMIRRKTIEEMKRENRRKV